MIDPDVAIFALLILLLLFALGMWAAGAWLEGWKQGRQEIRDLEEAEEDEAERLQDWDAQRAAELAGWLHSGSLPTTVMRTYPTPDELSWDWARLRDVGYRMDHDPVVLDDGDLMVNYSLERKQGPTHLRVVGGELPPPPR
jgi:hypothetical protein